MRYLVMGAGAVGATVGGHLALAGQDVTLVARGRHLEAMQGDGLRLVTPAGEHRLALPVVGHPDSVDARRADVVLLGVKSQDTPGALDALIDARMADRPVLCLQNGVENERVAARRFADVYGVCVMLPATHLEPGVVVAHGSPHPGLLDLGRFPSGCDDLARVVAADLASAGFSALALDAVMRWKYGKLLLNLGNALEAACGDAGRRSPLYAAARDEAVACYRAAGIDFASAEEDRARRGALMRVAAGMPRQGGSTWQSLARGAVTVETDYLNGEIVLLGRLHGVATPVNLVLQQVAAEMARLGRPAGSVPIGEVEARVATASGVRR